MMTTLQITGMMCQACVSHVERALKGVDGVRATQVEIGHARVEGEADAEALVSAVADEGYSAQVASQD